MKPEQASLSLLGVTRSKAKMYEYGVPLADHIKIVRNPAQLFTLAIGLLGDISAASNRGHKSPLTEDLTKERQQSLTFAARFFDAYLQARLEPEIDAYLLLLSSSAFYLCDLPGTSHILAARIADPLPDLEAGGLEKLLHWILLGKFSDEGGQPIDDFSPLLEQVRQRTAAYYANGDDALQLLSAAGEVRQVAYEIGSPRQLLLADIVNAVVRRRIQNSAWHSLPTYSPQHGVPRSKRKKRSGSYGPRNSYSVRAEYSKASPLSYRCPRALGRHAR